MNPYKYLNLRYYERVDKRIQNTTVRSEERLTTRRGSSLLDFNIQAQKNILKDFKELRQKISFYLWENNEFQQTKMLINMAMLVLECPVLSVHHFCKIAAVKYEGDSLWVLTEPLEVYSGI